MENTTEIDSAIETLTSSAKGLTDFYEELYGESISDFDASDEPTNSVKSDLWRRASSLQQMAEELQSVK
jgi:hypothetical protein|tara:strand:+ start:8231 stop:8437 length:207 start_codon:yes stop_codon:yes gene_type:complete